MNEVLLDASALLALLQEEPGAELVQSRLPVASINTLNLAEVCSKLADAGMPQAAIGEVIASLKLQILPFDAAAACEAGRLRPLTRHLGLSLGDRACLASGKLMALPILTTDSVWAQLALGVSICTLREPQG